MRKVANLVKGLLLIFLIIDLSRQSEEKCSNFKDAEKFDCNPENGSNEASCLKRGCCWASKQSSHRQAHDHFPPLDVPWCHYPKNFGGYEYVNMTTTDQGAFAFLKRNFPSPYPRDVQILRMNVEYQTADRVRVKVSVSTCPITLFQQNDQVILSVDI